LQYKKQLVISTKPEEEIQKDEKLGRGSSEGHCILSGGQKIISVLKIPRLCLLILPGEVRLKEGKALGSDEGK
jgi:hypothetical protein